MGKALYRTYRSTSFDEVLGQNHITTTLKNALKSGHISHAYLLTGPRGVGKTSVARILAHAVNNLDYSQDQTPMDIIEIDAASNRRIDEIRDLRERVMIAPTSAKYKVYIIDEVHMLTREAFNALLKTLEEPPAHVIFILATTEFHKLPDTIISRCLRFNFKPIEAGVAAAHLRHIAKSEGLKIDDEALELIAQHGDGSFRDSISQLDQIRGVGNSVSLADVQNMLGIAPKEKVADLLKSIISGDPAKLLAVLSDLYDHGANAETLSKQLSSLLRAELLSDSADLSSESIITILKDLLEVQAAYRAKAQLELVLLDILLRQSPHSRPSPATRPTPKIQLPDAQDQWTAVLADIKAKNNTLYSIARMAHPEFFDDKLVITFRFAFHHKQISEPRNKSLITDVVRGKYPNIATIDIKLAGKDSDKAGDPVFSNITNIFGSAEVLES